MQGSTKCSGQPAERARAAGCDELGKTRREWHESVADRVQSFTRRSTVQHADDVQQHPAQFESTWTDAECVGDGPISSVESRQPVRNQLDRATQLVAQLLETVRGTGEWGKYIGDEELHGA